MNHLLSYLRFGAPAALATVVFGATIPAQAAVSDALEERLRQLEAEVQELKNPQSPVITADGRGLTVSSHDGAYGFRLRAALQADGRFFLEDESPSTDTFLLRRLRPTFQGHLGELVSFRLTADLDESSASIIDAYIDVHLASALTLRGGFVKGPVGLERLQSAANLAFNERAFPTELVPNREIGLQLQGDLLAERLSWVLGVYNGAADGRSDGANPDDQFEIAGRLFAHPFAGSGGVLDGFGLGVAASHGKKKGGGNALLPRYRSAGQETVFQYNGGTSADGDFVRISPQGYWYAGSFGVLAEYIISRQQVINAPDWEALSHHAWAVSGSWVLTGEKPGYGGVRPASEFGPGGDGWGAFELVARAQGLEIDRDAFPIFASRDERVSGAVAWGLGLNWWLTRNLKAQLNYVQTRFDDGAVSGDREDERVLFTRLQLAF